MDFAAFWTKLKDSISNGLVAKISDMIPNLAIGIVVFILGYLIAKGISTLITRVLNRVGIDKLGKKLNDVDFMQENNVELRISSMVGTSVYYLLMLIFIIASTDVLGVKVLSDFMGNMLDYFPKLMSALVIVMIGVFVSDMISKVIRTACDSMGMPSGKLISSVVFYLLLISIIISALSQAEVNTTFLANNITVLIGAAAAAFAIGYGLASRDLASNYLASFYNKNKVRVGDEIVLDGVRGKVVLIDSSSLVIQTNDSAIIFPLSKLTTQKVEIIYPDGQDDRLIGAGRS